MGHLSTDKYSVAWFKLAEFVARGEKERALGLFRLLAHSFEDAALTAQLEGDLLTAFRDVAAYKSYERAATEYQKTDRVYNAAAVYEHLVLIGETRLTYLEKLTELYAVLCNEFGQIMCKERILFEHCQIQLMSLSERQMLAQEIVDQQIDKFPQRLDIFLKKLIQIDAELHSSVLAYLGQNA
jgi:hypothetical protein